MIINFHAIFMMLVVSTVSFGDESLKYATPEELGNPAMIQVDLESDVLEFIAEMVQIEMTGPSPFNGRELKSPRPAYLKRTLRRRACNELEIIGQTYSMDPEHVWFNQSPLDVGVPWEPSINAGGGFVWVLFTRNTFHTPKFLFYKVAIDAPGSPLFTIQETEILGKETMKNLSKLPDEIINPRFKVGWEDETFIRHKGKFRIDGYENGVVVFHAPVLARHELQSEELNAVWDIDFRIATENHQNKPESYPEPVHYKELMKDEIVEMRFDVGKNEWQLKAPKGYAYPGND